MHPVVNNAIQPNLDNPQLQPQHLLVFVKMVIMTMEFLNFVLLVAIIVKHVLLLQLDVYLVKKTFKEL